MRGLWNDHGKFRIPVVNVALLKMQWGRKAFVMITHKCAQGELEWLQLRAGKVTASEASALLTPLFKVSEGAGVHTYLCTKVAETFGEVLPQFSSWETEHGQILEDEARKWYAFQFDNERLHNVGFCESDDHRSGCSPDALIGDDGGLELKCPQHTNHIRYLLDGVLPKDYVVQVHFSMFVTGRKWWKFVSYHRKFPPFVLKVDRDEAIQAKIREALTSFNAKFDAAMATVRKIAA